MTTREGEARPAERTAAQAETAPGPDLSSPPAASGDAAETAPLSGTVAAPPDDARRLELEIERTREQLGETVQELIARADVKGRALARATELSEKCKTTMAEARKHAAARAVGVRGQVAGKTAVTRQRAAAAGKARKDQLRGRVAAVGTPAWEAMPDQVRRAVTKGASGARQHWMPVAIAAGVVIIACLAVRYGRCDRQAPLG